MSLFEEPHLEPHLEPQPEPEKPKKKNCCPLESVLH